jgi:kinesin family protein 3/17
LHKDKSFYVNGLSKKTVGTSQEVFNIFDKGHRNRSIAATAMNAESSRSHSIFTIYVEMEEVIEGKSF